MKKLVFLVVIAAAVSSHAAKFETCMNEVKKECGSRLAKFASFKVDGTDCKIVQGGEREDYPNTRYGTKVVFKDANTMLSIVTSPGGNIPACSVREVNIRGEFKKDKASDGRLFAVTSAGNIIVITRNQTVQYLTNKNGDPLQNVTD